MTNENIFHIPPSFDGNCETALTTLNQCINDYVEYIASCATISKLVIEANDNLYGLTNVSCRKVYEDASIINNIHEIANKLETKTQELVTYLATVKEYKRIMNSGGNQNLQNDLFKMMQSNDIISFMADNNVFWIVESLLNETGVAALSFIGSLMAYGTDATNEGGKFVVDGVVKKVFSQEMIWGAAAAAMLAAIQAVYFDEGKFTARDGARMGLDMLEGFILVGEWSVITNAVAAGISAAELGAIAGPIGVVVASAAGVLTSLFLDTVFTPLTGDNVIHTAIAEDGTEIPIYANGNGKNGTYDVLLERASKLDQETFNYNDREYSYTNYKTMIYDNPEIAVDACNENKNIFAATADENAANTLYESIASCSSAEEAQMYFDYHLYNSTDYSLTNTCIALNNKGFDPAEYYTYVTTGSLYGTV